MAEPDDERKDLFDSVALRIQLQREVVRLRRAHHWLLVSVVANLTAMTFSIVVLVLRMIPVWMFGG